MRLDKSIAQQLDVSRAIAGCGVRDNRVTVDDEIAHNAASKLLPEYDVAYDDNPLAQQHGPRYFMLNRPQGYVCSTDDLDHSTVLYFLDEPVTWELRAAGRLNIDTTGLVLMTDDGQWSHRITSPRHHCEKTYLMTLESPVADDTVEQFAKGVQLHNEKGLTKSAVLEVITPTQVRLTISEGRCHQVKRTFAAVGNHVVELYRKRIGDITLDADLAPDEHRPLTEGEITSVVQLLNDFQEPVVTTRQHSSFTIVSILSLLAMLMPLSVDIYLPALPVISAQFGVPAGSTQTILSTCILGFALGQSIYEPMADSFECKPVVLGGMLVFAAAAAAYALVQTIDQLIAMRFFHGLATAAASVVINALMRNIYPKEEFSWMMSSVMLVTAIVPLMAPIVGDWVLVWLNQHYIFWILAVTATLTSAMIFFLIKETLPPECRQPFHIRTTIGNFAALFRHRRVLSYMLAGGFSFTGMFSFLSAGPFVYIEINHVAPGNFGYYFTLNVVSLFVTAIFNSRFVRRIGALNMFRSGLWIQFTMAVWMVISALLGLGFWSLVIDVAAFVGCMLMVPSNAMAAILDELPHMAGTVSSLARTFRFGTGAIVGALLSLATFNSAWPMIWSIAFCATSSILFCLYASRPKRR